MEKLLFVYRLLHGFCLSRGKLLYVYHRLCFSRGKLLYICLLCGLCFSCGKTKPDEVGKFAEIYLSLEKGLEAVHNNSEQILTFLRKGTELRGNEPYLVKKLQKAKDLRRKTAQTISTIEKVKKRILFKSKEERFTPTTIKELRGIANSEETELMLIGRNKNGEAYKVAQELDVYVDFLNKEFVKAGFFESPFSFEKLTQNTENKDFAVYYFANTPSIMALATLTQKQIEVLDLEQECLRKLGFSDSDTGPRFDEITPWTSAESNKVEEGAEYVAYMSLSQTSSKMGARMTFNGQSVKVNSKGFGEVRFKATGRGKQKWFGTITMRNRGKDTTFYMEREYEVIEPRNK